MTPQEIFDKVLTHLRTQGKPAIDFHGSCAYRGAPDDNTHVRPMCAIGCLIPDDKYTSAMEGVGVYLLLEDKENGATIFRDFSTETLSDILTELNLVAHLALLDDLRNAHDEWLTISPRAFEGQMKCLADKHQLEFTA